MRILIVEDEKDIRETLKNALEAACYAIDIACDGEEGSYLARTNNYDLIILDDFLPKKTGYEVCKELRQMGKHTPILMFTITSGDTSSATASTELLNAGADDCISKPYSLEELLARVRALMRRPPQMTDEVIRVGDLSLDTQKHEVVRGKDEIRLTRKEFMLLEYLMQNADFVLSRNMILEHVWDINADPFSNTIESHILSLRKKLGVSGTKKEPLIHTISGRGYKLAVK